PPLRCFDCVSPGSSHATLKRRGQSRASGAVISSANSRFDRRNRLRMCLRSLSALSLPGDILKKLLEGCLSRTSVKGISSLLEFLAVQQALNIPGDGVGCHDERVVQRMDISTGHRTVGMTKERRNCELAEAKVVGNARKTVP